MKVAELRDAIRNMPADADVVFYDDAWDQHYEIDSATKVQAWLTRLGSRTGSHVGQDEDRDRVYADAQRKTTTICLLE